MLTKLDGVAHGKKLCRGEGQSVAHISIYFRESCRVLRNKVLPNSWVHPILGIGCYLNPAFREMKFISDTAKQMDLRLKAELFRGN